MMGYGCTCARAHPSSESRGRLDGLHWNLVCGCGTNSNAFYRYSEWSTLYVRTCTPLFHVSVTAGRFVMKFGVLLDTHSLSALHGFGNIYTIVRSVVHPYKRIYSLPLVHIGVLMVFIWHISQFYYVLQLNFTCIQQSKNLPFANYLQECLNEYSLMDFIDYL